MNALSFARRPAAVVLLLGLICSGPHPLAQSQPAAGEGQLARRAPETTDDARAGASRLHAPGANRAAAPQEVQRNPALHRDTSPRRLGDIVPSTNQGPARNELIELKRIPLPGSNSGPGPALPLIPDTFIQSGPGPALTTTPPPPVNVLGVGSGLGSYVPRVSPPDPNGAAGLNHYVQWVNSHFAVFNKSNGQLVYGPAPGNTLWDRFDGTCAQTNDGDTIVQYDRLANRWVLTQFSVKGVETNAQGDIIRKLYRQCVAISTTPDPLGLYDRFEFEYRDFNDYPKMSVWPDGYYISFNMFRERDDFPGSYIFLGTTVCAYDRRAMLREVDRPVTQQCTSVGSFGGLLPADLDGTTLPPPNSPGFFINFGFNALQLWRFRIDWDNHANSRVTGPHQIPVASFMPACAGGTCIIQRETNLPLDSLADRLMYRLAYRHFRRPDGTTDREVLLVNHSVAANIPGGEIRNGIRWYELRNQPGRTIAGDLPRVHQYGTFAPDSEHRWMGSIAMDKVGNIGLGYSISGPGLFPSLRYTGRTPSDPPGRLRAEVEVVLGNGSQNAVTRWGDYSSMSLDPADDCTMWYTGQYRRTTDSSNWSTRIYSFRLPNCQ